MKTIDPYPMSILGYRPVHCAWCGRTLAFYEDATKFTVWCENMECLKHDFPFTRNLSTESLKKAA